MADMGTAGDTAVMGVTGAIRNPLAKAQNSRWQWALRPMPHMVTRGLRQKANGTGTGADLSRIESRSRT